MFELEDLDEKLAADLSITDKTEEDPNQETETEEEIETEEEKEEDSDYLEVDEEEEEKEEETQPEQPPAKPTKDEKKDYAFAKMRKETEELKAETERLAKEAEFVKNMALQYGYTDVEQFKTDVRNAQIAKEAQEKNIDPALYRETMELKDKVAQLERENREKDLIVKATAFKDAIDKAIDDYELGENGRDEIFTRLENAGYNVDLILQLPNPKIVIDGLFADKLQEKSKQEQLKKIEKLDRVADEQHTGHQQNGKLSIDDLLKEDLKEFKKNNYL